MLFRLNSLAVVLAFGVLRFRRVFRGGLSLTLTLCPWFSGLDLLTLVLSPAFALRLQLSGLECLTLAPRVLVPPVMFVAEMAVLLD